MAPVEIAGVILGDEPPTPDYGVPAPGFAVPAPGDAVSAHVDSVSALDGAVPVPGDPSGGLLILVMAFQPLVMTFPDP